MVGVDQLRMDLSPLSSITTIVLLRLMALGALSRQSDVRTLAPLDRIVVRLVGCQGGPLILLS